MRSLLAAVGVESYPVAIFSGNRRYVRPDWPSPQQFNHVIIAVRSSGELEAPAVASAGDWGKLLLFDPTERRYSVVLEADSFQETVEVDLPLGFSVDEMPEPVALATPFGRYRADWRVEAGKLFFKRHLELDNAVVPPEDYASVKEFFDEMIADDQAPVVLMRRWAHLSHWKEGILGSPIRV